MSSIPHSTSRKRWLVPVVLAGLAQLALPKTAAPLVTVGPVGLRSVAVVLAVAVALAVA